MPTKPVTYWIDTDQTRRISEMFGDYLQHLTLREKSALTCVLAMFHLQNQWTHRTIEDALVTCEQAWLDAACSDYGMCSEDVLQVIEELDGITKQDASSLLEAILGNLDSYDASIDILGQNAAAN